MGIKDEELEGLSDEERAALEDDDEDSEILGKIAGEDDDNDDDEEQASDSKDDDDSADADDGADSSGDTGDEDGAADDSETVVSGEFRPEFRSEIPENLNEKLASINDQIKEIRRLRDEGEIDHADADNQIDVLNDSKRQLEIADAQAKWSEKQNAEIEKQFNERITKQFFDRPASKLYEDEIMYSVLDRTVAALRAKDPGKGYEWALNEADRQVRQRFNLASEPKAGKQAASREPDLSKVPKTLAQLPAAEMAETGNEEFAYLDKLDGIALEQALRKMTPEQEARYLGAAA